MTLLLQIFTIAHSIYIIIAFSNNINNKYVLNPNNIDKSLLYKRNSTSYLKSFDDLMHECAMNDVSIPESGHLIPGIDTELLKARMRRAKSVKGLIKPPKYSITGNISTSTNYAQSIYNLIEEYNQKMLDGDKNHFYEPRGLRDSNWWDRDMTFQVFPVYLDEGAPICAGQIARVTLDEKHRNKLLECMNFNKIIGVCIAFIRNDNPDDPNYIPELIEYGSISELLDISELDTEGVLIIRPIERFKILKFEAIPGDTHMKATVRLIRDEYQPLRNLNITLDNIKALYSLYDKCNFLQEEYCKLVGRVDQMKSIAEREDFNTKVDGMISHIEFDPDDPNLLADKEVSPTRMRIFEILSFCAMEFHCDENTRIWASRIVNTEERLIAVRLILEKKVAALKAAIERITNERRECPPN